jgi:hypothetical protein
VANLKQNIFTRKKEGLTAKNPVNPDNINFLQSLQPLPLYPIAML